MLELYDPTPTYYFMGKGFVDLGRFVAANPKGAPVKVLSKRWELAIKELRASAPKESQARAIDFEEKSAQIWKAMANGSDLKNLNDLETLVNKWAPPPGPIVLFKNAIESTPIEWKGP
jgi:hypothetical protein